MSDLYSELLVKKEPTAKDSIVKYGMIVLTVLAAVPMFAVDMQHSISGIKAWAQAFLSVRSFFSLQLR